MFATLDVEYLSVYIYIDKYLNSFQGVVYQAKINRITGTVNGYDYTIDSLSQQELISLYKKQNFKVKNGTEVIKELN